MEGEELVGVLDADERAGVARRERPLAERRLHARRQLEEPERVGDRRPALPHLLGHLLLRQADLLHEALVAERHLDRVEVLALDVLDDGHLEHGLRVRLADVARDAREPGAAGRPEPALARDQLVAAVPERPDRERLDDPELADRGGKLVERPLVEVLPRLVRVGADGLDLEVGDAAGEPAALLEVVEARARPALLARARGLLWEEGAEALAEGGFLGGHRARC